jgi:hypothetical protein
MAGASRPFGRGRRYAGTRMTCTFCEVCGARWRAFANRRVAEKLPNIFAAWNGNHVLPRFLATGRRRGLRGFSSSIASLVHMLASFRNVAVVSGI